jgi:hypothetical protein
LVRNRFNAEHIGRYAVNQRKGKTGKNEPVQVWGDGLTDFGMIKQKIGRASDFGFETFAQTGDL